MAGAGPRQGDGRSRHPRCFAWPRGGPHPRARAAQGGPQAGSGPQSRPRAQGRGSHAHTWTQPGASVREGQQSRRTCRRLLLLQVIHQRVNLVSASDVHCKRKKRHRHAAPLPALDRARPHHGPEDGGPSVCRRGRQTLVAPPPAGRPPRSLTVLVCGPWPHGDSRVEVRGFSGWGDGRAPASTETHAVHPGQHSDAPDVTVGVTSTTLTGESAARQQPE